MADSLNLINHMSNPIISIVIPVFNGGKYLAQTLNSLLNQTFSEFEVIVVNDCSTDDSQVVVDEFKLLDSRIISLNTNKNLGIVPKVLAFVLPSVRGSYFLYASQDDLFSIDWLEQMYERARVTGADAVIPDMKFFHEDTKIKDREWIGLNGNRDIVLTNRDAVLLSLDWTIHGFVLWKINIIREIGFFEFGMYADDYSVRNFFFNCNKVVFSKGIFCYRQDNPAAITKKVSYKRFDQPFNYYKIYQFLSDKGFPHYACERELEKSVVDLIGYAIELVKLKETQSVSFVVEAESRIQHCFNVLSDRGILNIIKKFGGVKGRLRYLALKGGYISFGYWCKLFSSLGSMKKLKENFRFFNMRDSSFKNEL